MERKRVVSAAIVALVFAASVALMAACMTECGRQQQAASESDDTREPARGLDIVSYAPPKWGGGRVTECWYLVDRLNNHKFWLLKIDGQWVPLDIGEVENLG